MLDKLYITPRQWLRILRWTLYAALFLLALLVQTVEQANDRPHMLGLLPQLGCQQLDHIFHCDLLRVFGYGGRANMAQPPVFCIVPCFPEKEKENENPAGAAGGVR